MHKSTLLFIVFLKVCLFLFINTSVNYGNEERKVQLSLISETASISNKSTILLGLRAKISPGWKTYWRSPGVSGYGVHISWEGSKNVKNIKLLWPLPHHAQTQLGIVNAYDGEVIFPLVVNLQAPSQPAHVALQIDMLVCDDANCLPVMEDLSLNMPVGPMTPSREAPLLAQAMSKLPKHGSLNKTSSGSFYLKDVIISGADDIPPYIKVSLTKREGTFSPTDTPDVFIEIPNKFIDASQVSLSDDHKTISYTAPVYPDDHRKPTYLADLIGESTTITVGYHNEGFEITEVLKSQPATLMFWLSILFIAFLGGLILNVMPCVLPVLSLKVLSIMRHGGGSNASVRQEFLATSLGITFSFLLLAGGAILIKASGRAIGWGVQFQDPYFLIGLIGILTLFACNLLGYFEFRLPSFLSSMGALSPKRERLLGSFLEGSLVTALATPCTAPFLGTALAFALSRGSIEILTIFFMMSLGLSAPFILIAFFPKYATKLPKPGAWMAKVKVALGLMLILTAIWLVYVLIAEIGKIGAFSVALMMSLISLVLKKSRDGSEARKKLAWFGASVLISASFMLPGFTTHFTSNEHTKNGLWHTFEPERISQYVAQGKTVLVSVTADWCLTCQANKYFILKSKEITQALQGPNVVAMEANWTNHDAKITTYLKSFNQYGIPFYAVYGCKSPNGRFLGQLLTVSKVLEALEAERCPLPPKKLK
jgi:suppressor for copper-sensitivity B